jgi:predicted transcriptional regulator
MLRFKCVVLLHSAVDRRVLVSAVGFRSAMILPLVDVLEPQEVALISGEHGRVVKTEAEVTAALKRRGIPSTVEHAPDWDVLAWSNAINRTLDRLKDERVTINVTAGHGLAVALFAIQAAQRGLPIACYNWEPTARSKRVVMRDHKHLHMHSPAAILNLPAIVSLDQDVLRALLKGPQSVGSLAEDLKVAQSTLSTCLARLAERGFLDRETEGRSRLYRLRDGIDGMIRQAVG